MGNHKMEHRRSCVSTTPIIVLKAAIVETWKHVRVGVT
jgi:hypothetical protein